MKNLMQIVCALALTITGFSNTQAQTASTININNTMPNRISMTVTIGRQTMVVSIIDGGCVISALPQKAYQVNTAMHTMVEISPAEFSNKIHASKQTTAQGAGERTNAGLQNGGHALSSGAGLMGGAMPGASIVSAAVSTVSQSSHSGVASAASAATSGRTAAGWDLKTNQTRLELPDNLPDGDYELTFVIAEQSRSGLKDTLKTQVRLSFSITQGVLKTKHDTAKNSISNVR